MLSIKEPTDKDFEGVRIKFQTHYKQIILLGIYRSPSGKQVFFSKWTNSGDGDNDIYYRQRDLQHSSCRSVSGWHSTSDHFGQEAVISDEQLTKEPNIYKHLETHYRR